VEARGGRIDWLRAIDGEPLPATAAGHDALVLTGGEMSVFDELRADHVRRVGDLYLSFRARGRPVLGSCLGAQLMAHALGAKVERMARMEFGFETLRTTEAAADDPVFASVPGTWRLFEAHRDRFALPEGAVLLMTGDGEPNQAFRADPAGYAFQCHFEAPAGLVRKWTAGIRKHLGSWLEGEADDRPDRILAEVDAAMPGQEAFARKVMEAWLGLVRDG
jgi:GMP synthase-like glutamine amidotransferase